MWNHDTYLRKVEATTQSIDEGFEGFAESESDLYYQYLLCSANHKNLMPGISQGDDEAFFREVLINRELAVTDFTDPEVDYIVTGDKSFYGTIYHSPRIFCTFHLGSYRTITRHLFEAGISFSAVVDQQTLEVQGPEICSVNERFKDVTGSEFKLLNAESGNIGLQMLRELKQGRSLLFYIDGNTGVGGMGRNDDKLASIQFNGYNMYARKGVAFISHVANVPLVPVLCYRKPGTWQNTLEFFNPIAPVPDEDREVFAVRATQAMYDNFARYLALYPTQWEGWLYVHKFFDLSVFAKPVPAVPAPAADAAMQINEERYGIFCQENKYFLFDKHTYSTFSISEALRNFLRETRRRTILFKEVLSHNIIQELVRRQVFRFQSIHQHA